MSREEFGAFPGEMKESGLTEMSWRDILLIVFHGLF